MKNSFAISLFVGITALLTQNVNSAAVKTPNLSKHPILLVVSFDGFRYDYLNKTKTPTLHSLQKEGVWVPYMQPQFPTKTLVNHHSIATGLLPAWHGVVDNEVYDPLYKKTLDGFSDKEVYNYHPDVLPFWIRNEQAGDGRHSGCYMWGGSKFGFGKGGNLFATHYTPRYDGDVRWNDRVKTVISWITHDTKPANMVYLYYNEPDSQGHKSGTSSEEILSEIRKVDDRTAHLVQELKNAKIYDKVNLIILSDHGMETVPSKNIIDTKPFVDSSLYTRYGNSPLFHIRPHSSSNIDSIYKKFQSASKGRNFTVYKKDELGSGPLKYGHSRRIMDITLLADPGYCFDDYGKGRFNKEGVVGIHGYDANKTRRMRALFIARGPLFKKGFRREKPFSNLDLFPLFSKIMGIRAAPNNGSLDNVKDILA